VTICKFTLYRLKDEVNALLYVGRSINRMSRIPDHLKPKPWGCEIASATFEHFATLGELVIAEYHAIKAEHPKYNIVGGA